MNLGGQAVIEGILIKSPKKIAVAVRLPNKKIKVKKQKLKETPFFFKLPLVRGVHVLFHMLITGISALIWSANQATGEKEEKIGWKELTFTLSLSLLFGLAFFVGIPFFATRLLPVQGVWFNLVEGLIRIAIFVGYIALIARMKDVRRLFQYHGAEHKVIACYEATKKVTLKNAKAFAKEHPRCGTSFIAIVMLISIIAFSFILTESTLMKFSSRILLIPVIAGISYEILKFGDRFQDNFFMRGLIYPGLLIQKITTQEPSNDQIEVGMKALNGAIR